MRLIPLLLAACLFLLAHEACGQVRTKGEFQLIKITKNLITAPEFTYTGAQQYQADQRNLWLEVEAEFAAAPGFTGVGASFIPIV